MPSRRTIGALFAIAVAALLGVWLYALGGAAEQLRAIFRPAVSSAPDPAPFVQEESDEPRAAAAEDAETADSANPQSAGPISGTAFSELLESGLLGEENDPAAAEELRNALRDAAEGNAEPE